MVAESIARFYRMRFDGEGVLDIIQETSLVDMVLDYRQRLLSMVMHTQSSHVQTRVSHLMKYQLIFKKL